MPNTEFSDEIVIRFALTNNEGDLPTFNELTKDEISLPKKICTLHLDLDYGKFDEEAGPVPLIELTILYDGISGYIPPAKGDQSDTHGFYWNEKLKRFDGYPTPVIRFTFSQLVHKESFLSLVMASYVNVCSKKQREDGSDGFYFEDYKGLARVLEGPNLKNHIKFLKSVGLYSGRVIKCKQAEYVPALALG